MGSISLSGESVNQGFFELEMIVMQDLSAMQDLPETYLGSLYGAGLFIHFFLIFLAISLVVGIAAHLLNAIGLSAMAKHRNIPGASLAWIPILGIVYMTGAVADHQVLEDKGTDPKLRYWLTGAMLVLLVIWVVLILKMLSLEFVGNGSAPEPAFLVTLGLFLIIGLPFTCAWHIAHFRLFKACQRENRVLFLILSIVLGISPVLVFALRHYVHGQRIA